MGHPKVGGRVKGTPNKKTQDLETLTRKLKCNPFEILLHFANGDWEALGYDAGVVIKESADGKSTFMEYTISAELRARCAEKACQYLYPKRRAIEVSGEVPLAVRHVEQVDLDERVKQIKGEN